MKLSVKSFLLLMIIFSIGFFAFCPKKIFSISSETNDPIKIGFFSAETTASLDFYSPWSKQGFELGLKYATNNTNTTESGRPYSITYYDTKGLESDARTIAKSAIERDEIDVLVGGTYSTVAAAISKIAKENQKLYFITPAADADLTGKKFNPFTFRVARNNWHDAISGINYAMNTIGSKSFAFLAANYSFGYTGVETMTKIIDEKNGTIVLSQYADLTTTNFTPHLTNILNADANIGIDFLQIIWSGTFAYLYVYLGSMNVTDYMNVGGAVIDIHSINAIERNLKSFNITLEGSTGFCVYGFELPDNKVNDWMVEQHKLYNIKPNAIFYPEEDYKTPELFTASGFATAQFIVNVTNAIPDLDIYDMINYLENNITIQTPKGSCRLRPEDHQGLTEMYIAEIWNDSRLNSETYGLMIPKLIERLDPEIVAPPIESNWIPGSLVRPKRSTGFEIFSIMRFLLIFSILSVLKRKKRFESEKVMKK